MRKFFYRASLAALALFLALAIIGNIAKYGIASLIVTLVVVAAIAGVAFLGDEDEH